jgi:hypothetical protein
MTATDPTPQPGEFHESDERPDDVAAAFDRGERGVTAPPPPTVEASGVELGEPTGGRTATTPAPAVHASGPRAGQPVTPTPAEQLVEHVARHGGQRPVADCQWCPEPEPEQVPVVVLEDALCRRVWAGALRWKAGQLRDAAEFQRHTGQADVADAMRVCASALEIDAHRIETGELTPWADQPEPPAAPAQPAASHASPHCGCGVNDAGQYHSDPICVRLDFPLGHEFQAVSGHPDDDECTYRSDRTDSTYCGRREAEHDAAPAQPAGDADRPATVPAVEWHPAATGAARGPYSCGLKPTGDPCLRCLEPPENHPAEPAGGPGWDRKTIVALAAGLAGEVLDAELISPERGRELRDQVLALLADLDLYVGALDVRSAQLYDALAERNAARGELDAALRILAHGVRVEKMLEGEREAARAELAEVRRSLAGQWAADHAKLTAELAVVVADRGSYRVASSRLAVRLAGATGDVERLRAEVSRLEEELVGVRSECDRLEQRRVYDRETIARMQETIRTNPDMRLSWVPVDRLAEVEATARRDAAADFGAWLATEIRRLSDRINVPEWILGTAGEVPAGTRPVPGSPEPDGGGDDAG